VFLLVQVRNSWDWLETSGGSKGMDIGSMNLYHCEKL